MKQVFLKHQRRAYLVRREQFAYESATPMSIAQFVSLCDKCSFCLLFFKSEPYPEKNIATISPQNIEDMGPM
jgi:hypothetical protein